MQTISDVMPLARTSSQDAFASITIKDLTLKEFEKSKALELVVNAKECKLLHTSDTVECDQVTCTLLDHKVQSALLKTDKAFVDRTKKTIFFAGNVLGYMKDLVVQGADIYYNFLQQTLKTDKNALYSHPDFSISCQQSFIDLKNNRIEMAGGVVNEFTTLGKRQQP